MAEVRYFSRHHPSLSQHLTPEPRPSSQPNSGISSPSGNSLSKLELIGNFWNAGNIVATAAASPDLSEREVVRERERERARGRLREAELCHKLACVQALMIHHQSAAI
jgi:hypothetical protein